MDIFQFSLVKPPTLSRHDRTSIIAFLRDWTQYQEDVKRVKAQPHTSSYTSFNVRDCIESSVLYNICVLELEKKESDLSTVEDDDLLKYLRDQVGLSIAYCVDHSTLFSSLRFSHYEDPFQSVHEVFAQSRKIIAEHGLCSLFSEHQELREHQVKMIVDVFHPRALQTSVRNRLELDKLDCKSDIAKFFKFLLQPI
jgi:hypothetical protein